MGLADVPWWVLILAVVFAVLITSLWGWGKPPWTEAGEKAYRNQLAYNNALISKKQSETQAQG